MKSYDISVAIPTYNRREIVLDTLKLLKKQTFKNFEVIVIDQTKDNPNSFIKKLKQISDIDISYHQVQPPSLPSARNYALEVSQSSIVLFLDDDVIPEDDLIQQHIKIYQLMPDVSAVAGRVLQDGFVIKKEVLRFDKYAVSHGVFTATEPSLTNAFPGGNHSVIKNDVVKAGMYETRYYDSAFREESDLSLRMAKLNMKIYFEPKACLRHLAISSGGTRDKSNIAHLEDKLCFYKNEMFFTIRSSQDIIGSLKIKHREYCRGRGFYTNITRTGLFFIGLMAAVYRHILGKKNVSKEVS
jgi:glycosyltransferase involved in cell wall biosynthesis